MSKIIYHKNCIKHKEVEKAKRMLNKIEKQFGGFGGVFCCSISLTGVNELDRKNILFYVEKHCNRLKNEIDKQLFQNKKLIDGDWNKEYQEGFYIPTFSKELKLIDLINKVYLFVLNDYPILQLKKSENFVFSEKEPQAKYNELRSYFEKTTNFGFLQEYFAVLENGETNRLYPLTFSYHDLQDAKSIYVQYY